MIKFSIKMVFVISLVRGLTHAAQYGDLDGLHDADAILQKIDRQAADKIYASRILKRIDDGYYLVPHDGLNSRQNLSRKEAIRVNQAKQAEEVVCLAQEMNERQCDLGFVEELQQKLSARQKEVLNELFKNEQDEKKQ